MNLHDGTAILRSAFCILHSVFTRQAQEGTSVRLMPVGLAAVARSLWRRFPGLLSSVTACVMHYAIVSGIIQQDALFCQTRE